MGQKVNPIGLRLGITHTWNSKWYSEKSYAKQLQEDLEIQKFLKKELKNASVSKIEIERNSRKAKIDIHTARPGIIIGRKGDEIEKLRKALVKFSQQEIALNIKEIKKPEIDAQLMAENIASQLERRVAYRRAIKRSIASAMKMGIVGCKIKVSGRLNGADMARKEWIREGCVRLHTLKAKIDYGFAEALTTYGLIGVKVWVYPGENFEQQRSKPRKRKER